MLSYRPLQKDDLPAMEQLIQTVLAALPSPRWYYYDEDAPRWLEDGIVLGCFDGKKLVGLASFAGDARRGEHSLAARLKRPRGESYDFNDVLVDPDYRRRGIARYFLLSALKEAESNGAKAVYCTVDPENIPSRRNFEQQGFVCIVEKESYDGRPRCYYCRQLSD